MTPAGFARLHAAGMAGRPWSEAEFAGLMRSALVFAVGDAHAAALGRVVADEAELLTIVTAPDLRRQGLGGRCLAAFEAEARRRKARQAFLEVSAGNLAARALYLKAEWQEAGRRKGYYTTAPGPAVDAILMKKALYIQ